MKNPKTRGQKRKLNRLLNDINKIQPLFDYVGEYEHYHVLVDGGSQNLKQAVQ